MPIYKAETIILKRRNQGESDRVLTLFTREYGLLSVIAKGSRKPKSKFSGHIELFTLSDALLVSGKTFQILNEMNTKDGIKKDLNLDEINSLHEMAEIIIKVLPEETPNLRAFETFSFVINSLGQIDHKLLKAYFEAQLLNSLGIYPELSTCLECGEKPEIVMFSKTSGGIYCLSCAKDHNVSESSVDIIKTFNFLINCDQNKVSRLKLDPGIVSELTSLVSDYLEQATMIELRSKKLGRC